MASLTVIRGPDRGKRFDLVDPNPSIGRDAKNSIRLHDHEISRHHAELRRSDLGYVLLDLQSSNGTYVNGERVDKSPVQSGDRILVGQTELIFTATPTTTPHGADLANKISMIARQQPTDSSAIYRSIKHSEGSQYLRFPERAGGPWLQHELSNLAVMYETSQAVSNISDIDQLLNRIMDLVFQSIKADRACIMLKDADTGELAPKAIRLGPGIEPDERITLSRTIIDWVLARTEGMIVLDAAQDERVSAAQSVAQLGIREAICVPLRGRHDTLGVIYVDCKSDRKAVLETQQPAHFNEEHLKLIMAIAYQAGLAIEDSRYYQAMLQAERLAAVGQTIAALSHHIKNILQGLRSGSYLIEMGLKEKTFDHLQQGWSVVQKNQDKIYNLVMDMLSFSKEREPALEMTDLNRVVGEVVELMTPRAKDFKVALETQFDPMLPEVAVDPDGMHRAVLNVVTNAIDAVEGIPDGKVVVETRLSPNGRYVHVTVTDNGVGIPENRMNRIFQIFSSTKGERGSGLGLAVSQKIAQEHGGNIHVASELGKGSRFTIELPLRRTIESGAEHQLDLAAEPIKSITDTDHDLKTQMGES